MVFVLLRVTTVKVIVSACAYGVKLNYLRLILNQKEPYTTQRTKRSTTKKSSNHAKQ